MRQNSFQTRHHSLYYLWHFIHPQGFLKDPQLVRSIWRRELCTSVKLDYVVDSPPTGSRISESLESGAGASSPRSCPVQCLSSLSASLSLVSLETERKHERSRKHVLVIVRENETATWQRGKNEPRLSRHVVVDGIWSIDEKVSRRRRQKLRYPRLVGFSR